MEVAKCVLAFDNLGIARTEVAKNVLTFDSLCGARNESLRTSTSLQHSTDWTSYSNL